MERFLELTMTATNEDRERIEKEVLAIVNQYEAMLKEIVIKKGETFDSAPYTLAIQTLNKLVDSL